MKSCDFLLFTNRIKGINYDEAVLCAGINNQLFMANYADKQLCMLQGRGILFIDELMKKLRIKYSLLNIEQLLKLDKAILERILIVLPFMEFEKIKDLKKNVVQFFNTYTTYGIVSIEQGEIVLEGLHEDDIMIKRIKIEDFKYLEGLKVKPIPVPCRIIYIEDTFIEREAIENCLKENMKNLLSTENFSDELGGWVKGIGFYDKVKEELVQCWDKEFNKVCKFVFFQSMLNGSTFFYRREFSIALKNKGLEGEYIEQLYKAGNLWRKLGRYLKSLVIQEKLLQETTVNEIMNEIKQLEMTAFNKIIDVMEGAR